MEVKIIELNSNKKFWEEVYFNNGNEKLFFHSTVKQETIILILVSLLFLFNFLYLNNCELTFYGGLLLFFNIIVLLIWIFKFYPLLQWRQVVKHYINSIPQNVETKLIYSDDFFNLIQGKEESIEKWTNIKNIEIKDNFISMYCEKQYTFPKKSMGEKEFEMFCNFVKTLPFKNENNH